MSTPVAVIDCGTGYTKMGWAGNQTPAYVIPTVYGENARKKVKKGLDDLDFLIGQESMDDHLNYPPVYPMKHGIVEDWNHMERLWQRCMYQYLHCDPEESYVLLTEPPLNPPENREYTAEVMFETFGVKGMHIAIQAVLALVASWDSDKAMKLGLAGVKTGTVIDSGDGVTHVIPIADGYVITSCIRHIPLAGRDVTNFVRDLLRDREEPIPPEDILQVARTIKEKYCYVCPNLAKEFAAYDEDPATRLDKLELKHAKKNEKYTVDIGYEKFLGPEIFFNPQVFNSSFTTPLPTIVDQVIQQSPVDCRRGLYKNICLSGGSTMFENFARRVERDVKRLVGQRLDEIWEKTLDKTKSKPTMDVNVIAPRVQRYAVWYGGSILSSLPEFGEVVKTKADYEEYGPAICRNNASFKSS